MKFIKRSSALFLALVMLFTLLPVMGIAAEGDVYEETDSYRMYYSDRKDGKYILEYGSQYTTNLTYVTTDSTSYEEFTSTSTLYRGNTDEWLSAYCVDQITSVKGGSMYQRINLEDATYFSDEVACKLRSIMIKGFPNVSTAELAAASGLTDLTIGEAVHATQLALWQTSYGSSLKINSFTEFDTESLWNNSSFVNHIVYLDEYQNEYDNYASVTDINKINDNVKTVFSYLMNLDGTDAAGKAVSANSFISFSDAPILSKNDDGTYNITVEATVDVETTASDSMTLTAVMENKAYYKSVDLSNGKNSYTITIENVPASVAKGKVKLAIDGTQTVSDAFLYVPKEGRDYAQSMIALDDGQMPVHAEVIIEPERIINFEKMSKPDGTPLEGIQFDIYFVCSRNDYLAGKVTLPAAGTTINVKDYANNRYGYGDYTVMTDSEGKASFNLTKNNMEDGVYLVVEQPHPAIETPVDPFFIIIPATSADGTHLEYEINIKPKNVVKDDVVIEKDVIEIGNDSASVDAYKDHTWIIGATIPEDIALAKEYLISDTLDNRLDYIGNVIVQVEKNVSTIDNVPDWQEVVTLTEGADYILTVTDVDSLSEGNPSDSFTIELTTAGMKKVGEAAKSDFANHMLRVYFDAQINANAEMGEIIPNLATLDYTNSVGVDFDKESDIPEVHTGGVKLLKADGDDHTKVLAGAEFSVYRPATLDEIADESITKTYLDGMETAVMPVEFFNNTELSGVKVSSVTSDENGNIVIYGLAYGTYYIVETTAPAGYNLLDSPKEITISESSHAVTEESITIIENFGGSLLPETGGIGTTIFYALGAVMVIGAGVLLVAKKRMSAAE